MIKHTPAAAAAALGQTHLFYPGINKELISGS